MTEAAGMPLFSCAELGRIWLTAALSLFSTGFHTAICDALLRIRRNSDADASASGSLRHPFRADEVRWLLDRIADGIAVTLPLSTNAFRSAGIRYANETEFNSGG